MTRISTRRDYVAHACLVTLALFGMDDAWGELIEHSRVDHLTEPVESATTIAAKTHAGMINVVGTHGETLNVTASIRASANQDEKARELLAGTDVSLTRDGSRIFVIVERPRTRWSQSVVVDLEIEAPRGLDFRVGTHTGGVEVIEVQNLIGRTHNGSIEASGIAGRADLTTHNGTVRASARGSVDVETHNGAVHVALGGGLDASARIQTHNGDIELVAPHDLSAVLDVRTHNGNISTDFPVAVTGTLGRRRIEGVIGDGGGRLEFRTHNGAVRLVRESLVVSDSTD